MEGTRLANVYDLMELVGSGTYGDVYKARNKETGEEVALKKIRVHAVAEGFPRTSIREIKILKMLDHENIVRLHEIVQSFDDELGVCDLGSPVRGGRSRNANAAAKVPKIMRSTSTVMVMEYLQYDLSGLVEAQRELNINILEPKIIKTYMVQLLRALKYLHSKRVIHRDLKSSNLLISVNHELKLADFGLSRILTPEFKRLTNKVISLWYRPPELLLGSREYDASIDMWSVGCVFAEMLLGKPLFRADTETALLNQIFDTCGTPSMSNWPDHVKLPGIKHVARKPASPRLLKLIEERLTQAGSRIDPDGLDLLNRLLCLDPKQRCSAAEALGAQYFKNKPSPAVGPKIHQLPALTSLLGNTGLDFHEYQARQRRHVPQPGGDSSGAANRSQAKSQANARGRTGGGQGAGASATSNKDEAPAAPRNAPPLFAPGGIAQRGADGMRVGRSNGSFAGAQHSSAAGAGTGNGVNGAGSGPPPRAGEPVISSSAAGQHRPGSRPVPHAGMQVLDRRSGGAPPSHPPMGRGRGGPMAQSHMRPVVGRGQPLPFSRDAHRGGSGGPPLNRGMGRGLPPYRNSGPPPPQPPPPPAEPGAVPGASATRPAIPGNERLGPGRPSHGYPARVSPIRTATLPAGRRWSAGSRSPHREHGSDRHGSDSRRHGRSPPQRSRSPPRHRRSPPRRSRSPPRRSRSPPRRSHDRSPGRHSHDRSPGRHSRDRYAGRRGSRSRSRSRHRRR